VHPSPPAYQAAENMDYHRADPRPFTPRGFCALEIAHREMMTRAVVCHPRATHEDFAIVSINLLPAHAMQFGAVQEVINEFLEEHRRVLVREIQPSHLSQALVHFENVHDRVEMFRFPLLGITKAS
jgi:hypothetical protein